jgi:hypothetical protein
LIQARTHRTANHYALVSQNPVPNRKASAVSMAVDSLMKGLTLLETKPGSGDGRPNSSYRLGERKLVMASSLPMRVDISARVNDLFKLELAIQS